MSLPEPAGGTQAREPRAEIIKPEREPADQEPENDEPDATAHVADRSRCFLPDRKRAWRQQGHFRIRVWWFRSATWHADKRILPSLPSAASKLFERNQSRRISCLTTGGHQAIPSAFSTSRAQVRQTPWLIRLTASVRRASARGIQPSRAFTARHHVQMTIISSTDAGVASISAADRKHSR